MLLCCCLQGTGINYAWNASQYWITRKLKETFMHSHPQVWAPIIFLSNDHCSNSNHFKQTRMKVTWNWKGMAWHGDYSVRTPQHFTAQPCEWIFVLNQQLPQSFRWLCTEYVSLSQPLPMWDVAKFSFVSTLWTVQGTSQSSSSASGNRSSLPVPGA